MRDMGDQQLVGRPNMAASGNLNPAVSLWLLSVPLLTCAMIALRGVTWLDRLHYAI